MALPTQAQNLPRGLRNNNPLNIRRSAQPWRHKIDPSSDPAFEQFDNVFWGIRAAFVIVRTYLSSRFKCKFVGDVIARWAPASENDTAAYVRYVCNRAIIQPTEQLRFGNKNQMCRLLWAMSQIENGRDIGFHYFETAYEMCRQDKR